MNTKSNSDEISNCNEIPFQDIRDSQDRSWSFTLLEEIKKGNEADADKIVDAISMLDDPRLLNPLTSLMCNLDLPTNVRQLASDALNCCITVETQEERREWWQSGEPVLMRHAIRKSEYSEEELIVSIALDPSHAFHLEAIQAMEYWEEPKFQNLIIQALKHDDVKVRRVAAKSLLWEQPVCAEKKLLEMASQDLDEAALAAIEVLCYCASIELLLGFDQLQKSGRESLRDDYNSAFHHISSEFHSWGLSTFCACPKKEKLSPEGLSYFRNWLKPVLHLLDDVDFGCRNEIDSTCSNEIDFACSNESDTSTIEPPKPSNVDEIILDLSDENGQWTEKKRNYYNVDHWNSITSEQRNALTNFLLESEDYELRDIACRAAAVWNDADLILRLLHDPLFCVRKSAAYYASFLAPDERIKQRLWQMLFEEYACNVHAQETLKSYLQHSGGVTNCLDLLQNLAHHDSRPSVRYESVLALQNAGNQARKQVESLIPLLNEAPANTWAVHCEILYACKNLAIKIPHLGDLYKVDNLHLQAAIAESL